ncbi:hypothetical protein ACYSNW_11130 [Enterococcus sp. LJL99]
MTKNGKKIGVFLVLGVFVLGLFNFSVVEAVESEYKQIGYYDSRETLSRFLNRNYIPEKYQTVSGLAKTEFDKKNMELESWFEQERELLDNKEAPDNEFEALDKDYKEKFEKLETEYSNKLKQFSKQEELEEMVLDTYNIYTQEQLDYVTSIGNDWCTPYVNLSGIENMPNLKYIGGEYCYSATDIRQLNAINNLEEFSISLANNANLNDLKNHKNLKYLVIDNADDDEDTINRTPLTDISVLSDLKKLTTIEIYTVGTLNTVTLKKGTKSYNLYEPVILSSQFENSTMEYVSFTDKDSNNEFTSNDEVRWDNLTGDEKYLSFSWSISAGKNMYYSGEARIPVRWK